MNLEEQKAFERGVAHGREKSANVAEAMGYFATARAILAGGDEEAIETLLRARQLIVRAGSMGMRDALCAIVTERGRQKKLWTHDGDDLVDGTGGALAAELVAVVTRLVDSLNETPENTFAHVLVEEVLEVLDASEPANLRNELVQVAAVAVKWVEAIDRREGPR